MSQKLVWMLGGGSAVTGVAVAGFLAMSMRDDPVGQAPAPAPLTQTPDSPRPAQDATAPTLPGQPAAPAATGGGDAQTQAVLPDAGPDAGFAAGPATSAPAAAPESASVVPPVAPPVAPPVFDVVRVARDGEALVAGVAAPGAAIALRVDGAVVAETVADGAGQFVALFSLGYSDAIQVLTLEMSGADGLHLESEDTVVLTPRPAPQIASATQDTQPADPQPAAPQLAEASSATAQPAPPPAPDLLAAVDSPVPPASPPAADVADQTQALAQLDPATIAPEAPRPAEGRAPDTRPVAPPPQSTLAPVAQAPRVDLAPGDEPRDTAPRVVDAPTAPDQDGATPARVADVGTAPADASAPEIAAPDVARTAEVLPAETLPAETTPDDAMPTAFLVRGSGAVEVLDRAPQVLDNVVIDSISYSAAGDVQIAGRAAQAAPPSSLRIYLNNQPIAVAVADRGDWASDLPNVDPGVYTLRVDQLSAEGHVVSRFETPFQREDPALVAQARAQAAGGADADPAPAAQQDPPPPVRAAADAPVAEGTQAPAATPLAMTAPDVQGTAQQPPAQELATRAAPMPADAPRATSPATPQSPATPPVSLITVQPGHTLWAISRDRYGAGELYVVIYHANRTQIRNPDLIYPGQIFTLPEN